VLVQRILRWPDTSEAYITRRGWESATIEQCPVHPEGGCGFARHTPYERVTPPGTFVARFYCPTAGTTVSLLPEFLAAHISGTLDEIEQVVVAMEQADSQERVAEGIRTDVELPGALRWMRRRQRAVRAAILALLGILGGSDLPCRQPEVIAWRTALGTDHALIALRAMSGDHLQRIASPLGFGRLARSRRGGGGGFQQEVGTDGIEPGA